MGPAALKLLARATRLARTDRAARWFRVTALPAAGLVIAWTLAERLGAPAPSLELALALCLLPLAVGLAGLMSRVDARLSARRVGAWLGRAEWIPALESTRDGHRWQPLLSTRVEAAADAWLAQHPRSPGPSRTTTLAALALLPALLSCLALDASRSATAGTPPPRAENLDAVRLEERARRLEATPGVDRQALDAIREALERGELSVRVAERAAELLDRLEAELVADRDLAREVARKLGGGSADSRRTLLSAADDIDRGEEARLPPLDEVQSLASGGEGEAVRRGLGDWSQGAGATRDGKRSAFLRLLAARLAGDEREETRVFAMGGTGGTGTSEDRAPSGEPRPAAPAGRTPGRAPVTPSGSGPTMAALTAGERALVSRYFALRDPGR